MSGCEPSMVMTYRGAQAVCTCGWVGPDRFSTVQARYDKYDHGDGLEVTE